MESTLLGVRKAAEIITATLSDQGNERTRFELELALVEACTNAVKHGASEKGERPFRVTLELTDSEIRVVIENHGVPFDLEGAKPPCFDPDNPHVLPTGGMGLPLMRNLMDSVSYEAANGVNRVALVKRLDTSPEEVTP